MTQQSQPVTLNILMTVDGLNYTLGALAKGPFEQVSDLITDLRTQAMSQLEAMKVEAEQAARNSEYIQESIDKRSAVSEVETVDEA